MNNNTVNETVEKEESNINLAELLHNFHVLQVFRHHLQMF